MNRASSSDLLTSSGGNLDDTRRYAAELVALAPDLIFAPGMLSKVSHGRKRHMPDL
jgi:hypothetical protein